MNILILSSNFPPIGGGIANFVQNITNELVNRGNNTTVLTKKCGCKDKELDSKQCFQVYRYKNLPRLSSLCAIAKTLYLVIIKKSELIFLGLFLSTHGLGAVLAQKLLGIPYVIFVHGNEMNYYFKLSKIDRWASNQLLKNADFIFVNSAATKKRVESYGYPVKKISIVHPGTDPNKFKQGDKNLNIIKKFRLNGKRVLLTVSRLVPIKNHENVLKALTFVIRIVPNLIYLIIGEGMEEERLEILTKDLGLEEFVKFAGYVEPDEISPYFNICDVFIMLSIKIGYEYESFGIVFLEANACSKPVIASNIGDVEEAVIDGVTGLLVDPHDVDEIARAIIRLLTDREYAQKLGASGRRRVERESNWQVVGGKIENAFQHLVKCNRKAN